MNGRTSTAIGSREAARGQDPASAHPRSNSMTSRIDWNLLISGNTTPPRDPDDEENEDEEEGSEEDERADEPPVVREPDDD
jgi:hypothetical protein